MKYFKILLITLLICNKVFAQKKASSNIFSFHIGPNFSNFLNAEAPDKRNNVRDFSIDYQTNLFKDTRISFLAGMEYEIRLKRNYAFTIGLNYENKGIDLKYKNETHYSYSGSSYERYYQYDTNVKNSYLTFPIGVKKYFFGNKFYVAGGAFISCLLKSEIHHDDKVQTEVNGEISSYSDFSFDFFERKSHHTNNPDYGFSLGTGLQFPLKNKLFLLADYALNISIRKIDKMNNNEAAPIGYENNPFGIYLYPKNYYGLNSNSKNISTSLTIGLGFNL